MRRLMFYGFCVVVSAFTIVCSSESIQEVASDTLDIASDALGLAADAATDVLAGDVARAEDTSGVEATDPTQSVSGLSPFQCPAGTFLFEQADVGYEVKCLDSNRAVQGPEARYHATGTQHVEAHWKEGILHGVQVVWLEDGSFSQSTCYDMGVIQWGIYAADSDYADVCTSGPGYPCQLGTEDDARAKGCLAD
jgi:hypothetical protein